MTISVGDRPALPLLKQQFSISELIVCRGDTQNHMVGAEETGLQEHTEENCLYCVGSTVLGYPTQPQINSTHPRTGEVPNLTQMGFDLSAEFKKAFFLFSFTRLCGLPIMGRSEWSSLGGDASVEVLWGVWLQ